MADIAHNSGGDIQPQRREDVSTSTPALIFRAPSTVQAETENATFQPPPMEFLCIKWHVTHSTLPMWKSNRNVTITYTLQEKPPGTIDDLVQYKPINSDKDKTVRGVDSPSPDRECAYTWRGRGWLKIASSKWEILGYGEDDGGWVVTYFAKTLFTPAGIDVYSRHKEGPSAALLERIRSEMKKITDRDFQTLADQLFEIKHD